MHAAFEALGRFSVRFRYLIIVVWIAAVAVIPGVLPSLSSVVKNDNTQFLPADAPSTKAAALDSAFQKTGEMPLPVVLSRSGQLTNADEDYIQALVPKLRGVPKVDVVRDLGRSPDGEADQVQVLSSISGGPGDEAKALVEALRAVIASSSPPAGLAVNVTGQLAIQVDTQAKSGGNNQTVALGSAVFILLILLLIFRAPLAPVLTLVPAGLVSVITGPIVGEIGKHGLKISSLAQVLLTVLILGAGTDYGLFLVFRVREYLRQGLPKEEAVVLAVARVGESITFSAGTVVAALLSLFAASFGVYHDLGVPLAIGIVLMLLAALTLLPALLTVFGRAVFWPSRTRPVSSGKTESAGLWGRVSVRIVQKPAAILALGVVVFGALASGVAFYKSGGFFSNGADAPAGTDALAGSSALKAHFPAAASDPTNVVLRFSQDVWTNAAPLQAATASLRSAPVFTGVAGPLTPNGGTLSVTQLQQLHQQLGDPRALAPTAPAGIDAKTYAAYRAESQYVSSDGHTANFDTGLAAGDPGTTAALNAVPAMRSATTAAAKASGAIDSGVTGEAPGIYDVSSAANGDLETVIPIAIVVIGFLLAFVMRSVVAPLYLIVSVGLSYLAALGLAVYVFQDLLGDGGLTFILPFLMFLFLLALGEDYNILVMTRIREEAQHMSLPEAVKTALLATGTTVTSAGVVLAGTFGVLAVAGGGGGSQIRDVGAGLAIGILMDTFLVRTLLVPSTVLLLGRLNWFPSRMGRSDYVVSELPPQQRLLARPVGGQVP